MTQDNVKISNRSILHYKYNTKNIDKDHYTKDKSVDLFNALKKKNSKVTTVTLSNAKRILIQRKNIDKNCENDDGDKNTGILKTYSEKSVYIYQDFGKTDVADFFSDNALPKNQLTDKFLSNDNDKVHKTSEQSLVYYEMTGGNDKDGSSASSTKNMAESSSYKRVLKTNAGGSRKNAFSPEFSDKNLSKRKISFHEQAFVVDTPEKSHRNEQISSTDIKKEKEIKEEFIKRSSINPSDNPLKLGLSAENAPSDQKTKDVPLEMTSGTSIQLGKKKIKPEPDENNYYWKFKHHMKTIGCQLELTYAIPSIGCFKIKKNNKKKKCKCKKNLKTKDTETPVCKNNEAKKCSKICDSGTCKKIIDCCRYKKKNNINVNFVECFYEKNKNCKQAYQTQPNNNEDLKNESNNGEDDRSNLVRFDSNLCFINKVSNNNFKNHSNYMNTKPGRLKNDNLFKSNNDFNILYHNLNYKPYLNKNVLNYDEHMTSAVTNLNESPVIFAADTDILAIGYAANDNNSVCSDSAGCSVVKEIEDELEINLSSESNDQKIDQELVGGLMDDVMVNAQPKDIESNMSMPPETVEFDRPPLCLVKKSCMIRNSQYVSVFVRVNNLHDKISQLEKHMKDLLVKHNIICDTIEARQSVNSSSSKQSGSQQGSKERSKKEISHSRVVNVNYVQSDNESPSDEDETDSMYSEMVKKNKRNSENENDDQTENVDENDKYTLERSDSNPDTICIKPPKFEKNKSCNCCDDKNDCCCVRIPASYFKKNSPVQNDENCCSCVDQFNDIVNSTGNEEGNSYVTKFVNFFVDNFFFYDDRESLNRTNYYKKCCS